MAGSSNDMSLSANNHPYGRGFTLIEILLTIALIGIIASMTPPIVGVFSEQRDLVNATTITTHMLREAQNLATSGYLDSDWGVRIEEAGVTLYKGPLYSEDGLENINIAFSESIHTDATYDILFLQGTGIPTLSSTVTFFTQPEHERILFVNQFGAIMVETP